MATESKFNCATHDSVVRVSDFASVNSVEEAESLIAYVKDKFGVDITANATYIQNMTGVTTDEAKLAAYKKIAKITDLKITEEKEQSSAGSTSVPGSGPGSSSTGGEGTGTESSGQGTKDQTDSENH